MNLTERDILEIVRAHGPISTYGLIKLRGRGNYDKTTPVLYRLRSEGLVEMEETTNKDGSPTKLWFVTPEGFERLSAIWERRCLKPLPPMSSI